MFIFCLLWFFLVVYMLYMEFFKFVSLYDFLPLNFVGFQYSIFFNFMSFFFVVFWVFGLLFPIFNPWVSLWFLFFVSSLAWLGSRTFTFASDCLFDNHNRLNWFISLYMLVSHLLGIFISWLALVFRISIVFLIGHFLMFTILDLSNSFFFLFFIIPVELFFAFLQSYIFLTLVYMFLINIV